MTDNHKSSTMRAYLQKEWETGIRLDRKNDISDHIYFPCVTDFTGYPDEKYDDELIETLTELFKAPDVAPDAPLAMWGFVIKITSTFDRVLDRFLISATVSVLQEFLDKLTNFIAAPTISIAGSYVILSFYDEDQPILSTPKPFRFQVSRIPLKSGLSSHEIEGFGPLNEKHKASNNSRFVMIGLSYSITLEWKDFSIRSQTMRTDVLEKLLSQMLLADCIIVASNNDEFECHRNILAAHSDVLHAMLTNGLKESQTNRIEMDDLSADGVRCLLAYMYGREPELVPTESITIELLKTGHKYNIANLEEQMLKLLCSKPADWFTIDGILVLYFFSVNIEQHEVLCEKLLHVLKRKPNSSIRNGTLFQEMMKAYPKEAAELALKLVKSDEDSVNQEDGTVHI